MIKRKLTLLQSDPRNHPQLDIKIMQGYSDLYRLRIGQYRLIYQIKENELFIFIMTIGNRGDVYNIFNAGLMFWFIGFMDRTKNL